MQFIWLLRQNPNKFMGSNYSNAAPKIVGRERRGRVSQTYVVRRRVLWFAP
ncbi:hypothetical protein BH20ACI3_BH20ACI3_33320 [soil metagenome]